MPSMQNTIVSPASRTGAVTVWVPPGVSNMLTDLNTRQLLYQTLRKFFTGGTFDRNRGLELRFQVSQPSERGAIIAGLKRHKIKTQ